MDIARIRIFRQSIPLFLLVASAAAQQSASAGDEPQQPGTIRRGKVRRVKKLRQQQSGNDFRSSPQQQQQQQQQQQFIAPASLGQLPTLPPITGAGNPNNFLPPQQQVSSSSDVGNSAGPNAVFAPEQKFDKGASAPTRGPPVPIYNQNFKIDDVGNYQF
ncbi:unnamed protein product, partial [Notodromas monacha]